MILISRITLLSLLPLLLIFSVVLPYSYGENSRNISGNERGITTIYDLDNSNGTDSKIMISPLFKSPLSDWIGIPLSKLIGTSDLIVYGSVQKVLDSTIIFHITQKISGNEKEGVVEIIKAQPDPFANVKPAPYHSGQCYLLFLINPGNPSSKMIWKIMGTAEEAQMPVIDNYIYFNDRYFEGIPLKQYKVNGVEQNIQRFEFSSFLNAVEEYTKCYQWTRQGNKYLPKKLCNDKEVALYGKKGFMHDYLVSQTQAFISN